MDTTEGDAGWLAANGAGVNRLPLHGEQHAQVHIEVRRLRPQPLARLISFLS
jgi:hypothetical protein